MIGHLLLLIFLFLLQQPAPGDACQPPMPAGSFQSNGVSMTVPSSPQYPRDPSGPLPPPVAGNLDGKDQLEMINAAAPAEGRSKMSREITPYPGYIPPPPAPSSDPSFPTLIDISEIPQNHVRSSQTFRSETPLQLLSPDPRPLSCPSELTSITDLLTCVRRLSTVTLDENNVSCDFEKDSGCRFKSISSPLSVGNFPMEDHYKTFATLAGRPEDERPTGNFVFFIEHRGTDAEDEFIMSTPITCQKGNGVLKFDYWIVGKQQAVMLRVCTQNHLSRSCTQSIAYNSASSSIAIEVVHPNSTFFELEIVASNLVEPTVIVYDNIEYKAELCEGQEVGQITEDTVDEKVDSFFDAEERGSEEKSAEENAGEKEEEKEESESLTVPSRPIRLSPRRAELEKRVAELIDEPILEDAEDRDAPQTVCKLLNCDFNDNMCLYNNYVNESMILSPWQVGNSRVGNPHTGVRDGSGFLYVGTDSPSDSKIVNYILESPDLSAEEDFHLSMDIYRRSNDITLQVCLDTPLYCPYTITPFDKEASWKEGELFLIPRGTLKIYVRAIQWRRYKWLAIDNLKVVTKSGTLC